MAAKRIAGITIEIGGDTTKLDKALSGVQHQLNSTQSSLKDIDGLLKLDPGNVQLLTQKQEALGKAVDAAKDKLQTEKTALQQMKDVSTTGEVTEEQKALEREIIATQQQLDALTKSYKEFGSVTGQQLQAAGRKVSAVGEKVADVGGGITSTVTTPIVAGFTAAIKTTMDFDAQMSKVGAIAGTTGEEMDSLRGKAREMGAKTKFSATEAGEAMEYMAMAGWKTEDMLEGVEGIMNLAAASGEDLGTTSDIVTDALTAFGLSAKDSGHFADVLAAASTNANTNVSMMGESFKYVAPVAGAMGYSAEDTAIALGLMANSGIKASSAGTALRNVITRMASPTKDSSAAMERLGISLTNDQGEMKTFREIMDDLRGSFGHINMPVDEFNAQMAELDQQLEDGTITEKKYDAAVEELTKQAYGAEGAEKARAAAMLAGKQGMSGLLAIVNAAPADYEKLTAAIDGSSDAMGGYNGQAEKMAAQMQDNLQGQLTILMSQLQELAISFGEIAMPVVREFVGVIQGVVDWFNKLSPATKETIAKVAALAAAIGPVLLVGGKLISGIGSVMQVGGKLISGIGSVMKVGGGLINLIGGAGGGAGLIGSIGGLITAAGPILAGGAVVAGVVAGGVLIYKNWDKIKDGAKKAAEGVKKAWNTAKTKVVTTFNDIKGKLSKSASDIAAKVKNGFDTAKTNVQTAVGNLATNAKTTFDNLKSNLGTKAASIAATLKSNFETAKTNVKTAVDTLASNAKRTFENMKDTLGTAAKNVGDAIKGKFEDAKKKAGDFIAAIGTGGKATLERMRDTLGTAAKTAASLIGGKFEAAKTAAVNGLSNIAVKVSDVLKDPHGYIKNAATALASNLSTAFTNAKNGVSTAVNRILDVAKNALSGFKWSFPAPKLPHFTLNWKEVTVPLIGTKFKVPSGVSVQWYKKAYDNPIMFTSPTILQTPYGSKGFGDGRGGEIVLSDRKLREIAGSGQTTYNINVYGAEGQSVNALANAVQARLVALQRQREAAGLA